MIQEHLTYLDELRESGATNMFGATVWLMAEYPELEKKEAKEILLYWIKNFDEKGTKIKDEGEVDGDILY